MTTTDAAIVEARGLRKRYGADEVVCGVDFTVAPRECFGMLGPNGAGKTTTIRMITCFSPPSAGQLTVFGLPVTPANHRTIKGRIGLAPQEENLDPDLSVEMNLFVYASYFGIGRVEARRRANDLLGFAALTEKAREHIRTLSGGMKRRLILARALINRPALLVLDEPTTGLDPQARHLVWERLRELKRSGVAMLLTTHYMEEAAQLCDRLVVMDHGRIISAGTPQGLIERHVGREVIEVATGGDPARRERVLALCRPHAARVEALGDAVVAYVNGQSASPAMLAALAGEEFVHRRATLEDVFLTLTGPGAARMTVTRTPRLGSSRTVAPGAGAVRPGAAGVEAGAAVVDAGAVGAPVPGIGFVSGALRIWRRDMESWRKYYRSSLVGALGEPILSLIAIGYGLGRFVDIGGVSYAEFLAPGILASSAMNAASFEATFGSFTRMTEQKTYDGILATPIGIREIVAGDILWAASKATLAGSAVLLVAAVAGLVPSLWALVLPLVALLIGLVFGAMGLVVSARARAYDFFTYYFTLVITVMYLFSGVFFPLESLPAWAQTVAWFMPLTHAVAIVRACIAGTVGPVIALHLLALAIFLVVSYTLAVRWIGRRLIA